MTGTIELVDGRWVLRDFADALYVMPFLTADEMAGLGRLTEALPKEEGGEAGGAEASLVYAEPGMSGTLELSDGLWILRNPAGLEFVLGNAVTPETAYPGVYPEGGGEGELYDAIFRGEGLAEEPLAYAEPGMSGTIDIEDGRWVLRNDGLESVIASALPPEEVLALIEKSDRNVYGLEEARFRGEGGVETSSLYAEPGMTGTVELADGRWVLRDFADTEYLLPVPYETGIGGLPEAVIGEREDESGNVIAGGAEATGVYAEPGMTGTIELVDGRWVLRDFADALYVMPFLTADEMGGLGRLTEALPKEEGGEAEASLVYAEPGMSGTLELSDGLWILKNPAGLEFVLGNTVPPETVYSGVYPEGGGEGELYDAIFRGEGLAEEPLAYAEPGMSGTIDIEDGRWVLRSEGLESVIASALPPEEVLALIEKSDRNVYGLEEARFRGEGGVETSSLYAEPGMTGTVELADGRWVLRDFADAEYLLPVPYGSDIVRLLDPRLGEGAEANLPYAEPGMTGTIDLADGRWVLRDFADAEYLLPVPYGSDLVRLLDPRLGEGAETGLPYAEPGMTGTIKLADGRWVLRDFADAEYLLPVPYGSDLVRLLDPRLGEGAETGLPYAEPGMSGTVDLVDGRWVLRDFADAEYLLPVPYGSDLVRLLDPRLGEGAEANLPYAEPGMSGTIDLADGRWVLRDFADAEYLLPVPYGSDLVRLLDPRLGEGAETGLPYAEPGMTGTIDLADGRWVLRDFADAEYLLPVPYGSDLVRLLDPRLGDGEIGIAHD
jgi:hypothetical protein